MKLKQPKIDKMKLLRKDAQDLVRRAVSLSAQLPGEQAFRVAAHEADESIVALWGPEGLAMIYATPYLHGAWPHEVVVALDVQYSRPTLKVDVLLDLAGEIDDAYYALVMVRDAEDRIKRANEAQAFVDWDGDLISRPHMEQWWGSDCRCNESQAYPGYEEAGKMLMESGQITDAGSFADNAYDTWREQAERLGIPPDKFSIETISEVFKRRAGG